MQVQLQELIDKIQNQGVKEAEARGKAIIDEAEKKAAEIIEQARKKASDIVAQARKEGASFENAGRQAVEQAGRDLILHLKTQITELFHSITLSEVRSSLKGNVLEEVLLAVINAWSEKGITDITLLLSPADLKKIREFLISKLSEKMRKGLEIKPVPTIEAGFRISEKDGTAYYNITDQGIAEIMHEYLSPELAKIMEGSKDRGKKE